MLFCLVSCFCAAVGEICVALLHIHPGICILLQRSFHKNWFFIVEHVDGCKTAKSRKYEMASRLHPFRKQTHNKGTVCASFSLSLEVMSANRAVCYVSPDIFLLQIAAGGCLQVQSHSRSRVTSPDNVWVAFVSRAQAWHWCHKSSGH